MIKSLCLRNLCATLKTGLFSAHRQQLMLLLLFFAHATLFAQTQLAVDINKTPTRTYGKYSELIHTGSITYYVDVSFYAESEHSAHLWRTDGTQEGTFRLVSFSGIHSLTSVGNMVYFVAYYPLFGEELFVTDGTKGGTKMVKDIWTGFDKSSSPQELINVNGVLYFTATDGTTGRELWKTNGTSTGTFRVKDILRVVGSSKPTELTNVNGIVYFSASDGQNGYELWKSNGTEAGTVLVKDVRPGHKLSSTPKELTNVNGIVYFTAYDTIAGRELWKSDGTSAGTVRVKDIRAGSSDSHPDNLTAVGPILYFGAHNGINGRELWKSNGTDAGTVLVKDIQPGPGSFSGGGFPHLSHFTVFEGTLYFITYTDRPRIWKTDGTSGGTIPISPLNRNFVEIDPNLTVFNGALYYVNNGSQGPSQGFMEMWKTDGTPGNHELIRNDLGVWTNKDMKLTPSDDQMFFTTWVDYSGDQEQLWFTDGTAAGTMPLDLQHYTASSMPENITVVNGVMYFSANGPQYGLFRSDGTESGTVLVKPISGTLENFYNANNTLYFTSDSNNERMLWKSDGTDAGTIPLKVLTSSFFTTIKFKSVNTIVFISVDSDLWRSDGTVDGTIQLLDFSNPIGWMAQVGTSLLFSANNGITGYELWKSDGTAAGTVLFKEIYPGVNQGVASGTSLNGIAYFTGNNGADFDFELWRSDGTLSGTYTVKDGSGEAPFNPGGSIGVANNTLYLFTEEQDGVTGLWKSDGTTEGTQKIEDLTLNDPSVSNTYIIPMSGGEQFYFIDGSQFETHYLWKSDGTAEGTSMVKSLGVYEGFATLDYAFAGNKLYFSEDNLGFIVRTDGTACGTFDVPFKGEPISGAVPDHLNVEVYNNTLYYPNYEETTGTELYRYIDTASPCERMSVATSGRQSAKPDAIIETTAEETTISSYPSPFNSDFILNVPGKENQTYRLNVMMIDGKSIEQVDDMKHNEIYRLGSHWTPGIYLLKIQDEKGLTMKKIMKTD